MSIQRILVDVPSLLFLPSLNPEFLPVERECLDLGLLFIQWLESFCGLNQGRQVHSLHVSCFPITVAVGIYYLLVLFRIDLRQPLLVEQI